MKIGLDIQQYQVFGGAFLTRCYQVMLSTEDLLSSLLCRVVGDCSVNVIALGLCVESWCSVDFNINPDCKA